MKNFNKSQISIALCFIFLIVFFISSALFIKKLRSKVDTFKSKIEVLKEYVTAADTQEPLEKRIDILNNIKLEHEKGVMLAADDEIIAESLLNKVDGCLKKTPNINVVSKETFPPEEVMQKYLRMFLKISMRASLEDFTKFVYSVIYDESYLKIKEIHVEAAPEDLLTFDIVIYIIYKRGPK